MVVGCPACTRVGEARALRTAPADGAVQTTTRVKIDVKRAAQVLVAGSAVGFMTGLFGVGGGFVIVPALTLVLGLAMPEAIGTSLLVISINSAVALATRLATTSIEWGVTLPFAVAAIAGVLAGTRAADRVDARRSLRRFAALLVAVAVYMIARAVSGLT
jgi:uncharacterized membrane protein YfcA